MIFITLGSQKFQFNRLLKEVDDLVEKGLIEEKIFAQIGYSDYLPKYFEFDYFIDRQEFQNYMCKADIVITHGGTGAIITAVKEEKRVIAVPRLRKFEEHVDDHQLQIVNQFEKLDFILSIVDIKSLFDCYLKIQDKEVKKYISNTHAIISSIDAYISKI